MIPPQLTQIAIQEIIENIWDSFLELEIQPAADNPEFPTTASLLTGQVALHGDWQGFLTLVCPKIIACKAATAMFNIAPDALGEIELRDTVGELTHILAGNLKSLLPAPSHLSLPVVTDGYNVPDNETTVANILLQCEGRLLQITLFKKEKSA
ncbi:MAG: chemotaxis protein CheX [Candidatus Contendobacter sp.]|nr:chemotaxis protein CheX [Candidatus Contendobacter sp.]